LATLFVMPVSGYLTGKIDPRILIGFALTVQGIALWNMSTLNTQITFENAAIARMVQSVALPFLFVPITNAAYVGLDPRENNQAAALLNVARNLGGTLGISFSQNMLAMRSQVHQAHYVETLNPLNPAYTDAIARISHGLMAHGLSQAAAAKAAGAVLYRQLLKQASMLSYIDVFHVLMIVTFCVVPLVFLMRGPDKQGGTSPEAAA
jgi:DHA2 family multidrug resistance protein